MKYTLEINEEAEVEEMPELLDEISRLIREGYTSGYYPTWTITEVEKVKKPATV